MDERHIMFYWQSGVLFSVWSGMHRTETNVPWTQKKSTHQKETDLLHFFSFLFQKQIFTKQTNLTVPSSRYRTCFRVRSRLHKYCADKSFWSDWSRATCKRNDVSAQSSQLWGYYIYSLHSYTSFYITTCGPTLRREQPMPINVT